MSFAPFRPDRALARLLVVLAWLAAWPAAAQDAPARSPVEGFLPALEQAIREGVTTAFDPLLDAAIDAERAASLRDDLTYPDLTEVVLKERDVAALVSAPPGTYRLLVEAFLRVGDRGRIVTYRLDVRKAPAPGEDLWRIVDLERLTAVDGLYRLQLDAAAQYEVKDLLLRAEDFELRVPRGAAFAARTSEGVTALVLLGSGSILFSPRPAAEQVQVRLFGGGDQLASDFTAAFIRLNPFNYDDFLVGGTLTAQDAVDQRTLTRAREFFAQQVGKSFSLDLSDLSRESWSLVPSSGDLIADVRTRRHGLLTYARSNAEAEDITLFDRANRKNISVYPSVRKLEVRGRSYSEDRLADYDVTDYDVQASYEPDREWMQGTTRMRVRVRAFALSTMTVRLAESLNVLHVSSDRHGRLLSLRVRGQNAFILSLPSSVSRDEYLTLTVRYAGRIESITPDREVVQATPNPFLGPDTPVLVPEARWVFSNRSYWHPQNTVSDFARGTLRLTAPAVYQVVASGDPVSVTEPGEDGRRTWEFAVRQPARYLSWAVSKFVAVGRTEIVLPPAGPDTTDAATGDNGTEAPGGVFYTGMDVAVIANPRQVSRGRALLPQVATILSFYGTLVGDFPYPSFTLALVDHELPGGHSPAYFALLHQPLPTTPYMWRNDPVHFDEYPQFFLAHELAHQFFGQAVGWKSYHEQWISEGFAQYLALLYAEQHAGPDVLRSVLTRMRSSALTWGAQGPIRLGYRLGHVKGDSRVFRAVVYNKSALVLHMLRGLLGDEAFFDGLRRFYRSSRFLKVGTDEAREAFEAASGRSLERFFERWVYEFAIPRIRYEGTVDGATLRVRFHQDGDTDFELPVTVALRYADGSVDRHVLPIDGPASSHEVPLRGPLRDWQVNPDRSALAHFERS